jgi:hypothetical protein
VGTESTKVEEEEEEEEKKKKMKKSYLRPLFASFLA